MLALYQSVSASQALAWLNQQLPMSVTLVNGRPRQKKWLGLVSNWQYAEPGSELTATVRVYGQHADEWYEVSLDRFVGLNGTPVAELTACEKWELLRVKNAKTRLGTLLTDTVGPGIFTRTESAVGAFAWRRFTSAWGGLLYSGGLLFEAMGRRDLPLQPLTPAEQRLLGMEDAPAAAPQTPVRRASTVVAEVKRQAAFTCVVCLCDLEESPAGCVGGHRKCKAQICVTCALLHVHAAVNPSDGCSQMPVPCPAKPFSKCPCFVTWDQVVQWWPRRNITYTQGLSLVKLQQAYRAAQIQKDLETCGGYRVDQTAIVKCAGLECNRVWRLQATPQQGVPLMRCCEACRVTTCTGCQQVVEPPKTASHSHCRRQYHNPVPQVWKAGHVHKFHNMAVAQVSAPDLQRLLTWYETRLRDITDGPFCPNCHRGVTKDDNCTHLLCATVGTSRGCGTTFCFCCRGILATNKEEYRQAVTGPQADRTALFTGMSTSRKDRVRGSACQHNGYPGYGRSYRSILGFFHPLAPRPAGRCPLHLAQYLKPYAKTFALLLGSEFVARRPAETTQTEAYAMRLFTGLWLVERAAECQRLVGPALAQYLHIHCRYQTFLLDDHIQLLTRLFDVHGGCTMWLEEEDLARRHQQEWRRLLPQDLVGQAPLTFDEFLLLEHIAETRHVQTFPAPTKRKRLRKPGRASGRRRVRNRQ